MSFEREWVETGVGRSDDQEIKRTHAVSWLFRTLSIVAQILDWKRDREASRERNAHRHNRTLRCKRSSKSLSLSLSLSAVFRADRDFGQCSEESARHARMRETHIAVTPRDVVSTILLKIQRNFQRSRSRRGSASGTRAAVACFPKLRVSKEGVSPFELELAPPTTVPLM